MQAGRFLSQLVDEATLHLIEANLGGLIGHKEVGRL